MYSSHEALLAVIPGSCDNEQLLVVHRHSADGRSRIELRQQTWGEGVGWFTQSSVPIEPEQLAALRGALGGKARPQTIFKDRPHLRVHAESA